MSSGFLEFKDNVIGFLFKDLDIFRKHEEQKAWITNAWIMNEASNRQLCFDLEEALLSGVSDKFILRCLYLGVNQRIPFIKYPPYIKKKKEELDDWLKRTLAIFYNISIREIDLYWDELIEPRLKSIKFKTSMANKLGLPNELRKKLGLKKIKHDKKIKIVRGVFDYKN